jgi:prolyl-tRNA editing enzyme YbaK/EbsC (Cys-tRNA(Pro) deacylase)
MQTLTTIGFVSGRGKSYLAALVSFSFSLALIGDKSCFFSVTALRLGKDNPGGLDKVDPHERVQAWLDRFGLGLKVIATPSDTATAEAAAAALGKEVGQIAKSLLFRVGEEYVMVVAAGDVKIKLGALKRVVGGKPRLATAEEVREITGYPVGGVCPFALPRPLRVLLDQSLARFPVVYAAAGTPHSAVPVTLEQLAKITGGEIVEISA